jgi:hypothetical protein
MTGTDDPEKLALPYFHRFGGSEAMAEKPVFYSEKWDVSGSKERESDVR